MMTKPFTPKRPDGRPLWRVVYDEVIGRIKAGQLDIDGLVTHDDLKSIVPEADGAAYYATIDRANAELRRTHSRVLEADRGMGYRLIAGSNQVKMGQRQRAKSFKSLNKAVTLVKTADRSVMSPADRTWADKVQNGMVTLASIAAMHEEKLLAIDEALNDLRSNQVKSALRETATVDELAELRRRVEAMESRK